MGRPKKLPTAAELGTTPVTFRVPTSLNEDFAIFAQYVGCTNPSEKLREMMRAWVEEKKKKDKRAMEFYAMKKGQSLLTTAIRTEEAVQPA